MDTPLIILLGLSFTIIINLWTCYIFLISLRNQKTVLAFLSVELTGFLLLLCGIVLHDLDMIAILLLIFWFQILVRFRAYYLRTYKFRKISFQSAIASSLLNDLALLPAAIWLYFSPNSFGNYSAPELVLMAYMLPIIAFIILILPAKK